MVNLKRKKGELTTQQIVLIIILIASFAVILFFIFRLNLGDSSQEQVCHNSVVLKGNLALSGDASLECYRSYECLTEDGSCEGISNPRIKKVESLDETYHELAENLRSCWWQFGEGKVNYVGKDFTHNNYCSICDQILLDDSLSNIEGVEDGKISEDGFYDYLAVNEIDNGDVTYAEYLFGTRDINSLRDQSFEREGIKTFGSLDVGKQYFTVMGIISEVRNPWESAVGAGGTAFTGVTVLVRFFSITPAGWVSAAIVGGTAATAAVATEISDTIDPEILALVVEGRGIENNFMAPTLVEANSERFKALNCEEILTLS